MVKIIKSEKEREDVNQVI